MEIFIYVVSIVMLACVVMIVTKLNQLSDSVVEIQKQLGSKA